jgi:hypothetical protein
MAASLSVGIDGVNYSEHPQWATATAAAVTTIMQQQQQEQRQDRFCQYHQLWTDQSDPSGSVNPECTTSCGTNDLFCDSCMTLVKYRLPVARIPLLHIRVLPSLSNGSNNNGSTDWLLQLPNDIQWFDIAIPESRNNGNARYAIVFCSKHAIDTATKLFSSHLTHEYRSPYHDDNDSRTWTHELFQWCNECQRITLMYRSTRTKAIDGCCAWRNGLSFLRTLRRHRDHTLSVSHPYYDTIAAISSSAFIIPTASNTPLHIDGDAPTVLSLTPSSSSLRVSSLIGSDDRGAIKSVDTAEPKPKSRARVQRRSKKASSSDDDANDDNNNNVDAASIAPSSSLSITEPLSPSLSSSRGKNGKRTKDGNVACRCHGWNKLCRRTVRHGSQVCDQCIRFDIPLNLLRLASLAEIQRHRFQRTFNYKDFMVIIIHHHSFSISLSIDPIYV